MIGGTGLGIAMISFIWSITNTSAAVTLLCLAAMPFMTAFLGFLFLHEKISFNVWVAIILASIGIIIINVLLCVGSLNLNDIILAQQDMWFVIPLFPMFVIFFISALAETNRAPFDLPEDESSLVGGYFTEYSSMLFAMFFLGEYAAMIMMSGMATILFLGGWLPPFNIALLNEIPGFIWFAAKTSLMLFTFLWVRATFPRFRYDQLMRIGWKVFLPFSLLWVVLTSGFLIIFDLLPSSA